jgi:hypothetical protein
MSELQFDIDPVDPGGAKGDELRATWASLRVLVDGDPVTTYRNLTTGNVVNESLYLPLYPMAEWLVANWWALLYEPENMHNAGTPAYFERHSLFHASRGYALPKLLFKPLGEHVELSWKPHQQASRKVYFLSEGHAVVDREHLHELFTGIVQRVLDMLQIAGVSGTVLQEDWAAMQAMDEGQVRFSIASAQLGLDPFNVQPDQVTAILTAARELPESLSQEVFQAGSVEALTAITTELRELLDTARSAKVKAADLHGLRDALTGEQKRKGLPFEVGYARARALRSEIGLNGDLLSTDKALHAKLGLAGSGATHTRTWANRELDALMALTQDFDPYFVVDQRRSGSAQRFALCRALHEYLFGPEGQPRLVTEAVTEAQRINRAFAAELLAPADALRKRASGLIYDDRVQELAEEFGVSTMVIEHQLENQGVARIARW